MILQVYRLALIGFIGFSIGYAVDFAYIEEKTVNNLARATASIDLQISLSNS